MKKNQIKNILLINPPFPMEERYERGIKKIGTVLPKLGLLYIASSLEQAGYSVTILDASLKNEGFSDINYKISELNPDIIGITSETANIERSLQLAISIKEKFDLPIIFGGPHATLLPYDILKCNAVDYIVLGEGEITIIELLTLLNSNDYFGKLKEINGIAYRENEKIVVNELRKHNKNLDDLPFPAYHLINIEDYCPSPHQYKRIPLATMVTSRGCPFKCTYCSANRIWNGKYVFRSAENVIEEIVYLQEKFGIKEILFWDDIFGLNKDWLHDFTKIIKNEKIDITWSCNCRIDTVSEKWLKIMAETGCWRIFYGIESMDKEILNLIRKEMKPELVYDTVKWTRQAGIEVHGNFILGLPKETPQKFKAAVKQICKIPFDYVKFNVLTPFPGTVLYDEVKAGKWGEYTEEYNKLTIHHVTFKPYGYSSFEELEHLRRWAVRKFYLRPAYFFKRILRIRNFEDFKRNLMGLRVIAKL